SPVIAAHLLCLTVAVQREFIVAYNSRQRAMRGKGLAGGGIGMALVLGLLWQCHDGKPEPSGAAGADGWTLRPDFLAAKDEKDFYQFDPIAGFVHRPGYNSDMAWPEHSSGRLKIRTNNLGFRRDTDTVAELAGPHVRILVLGDSHTEGLVPNRETFSTL